MKKKNHFREKWKLPHRNISQPFSISILFLSISFLSLPSFASERDLVEVLGARQLGALIPLINNRLTPSARNELSHIAESVRGEEKLGKEGGRKHQNLQCYFFNYLQRSFEAENADRFLGPLANRLAGEVCQCYVGEMETRQGRVQLRRGGKAFQLRGDPPRDRKAPGELHAMRGVLAGMRKERGHAQVARQLSRAVSGIGVNFSDVQTVAEGSIREYLSTAKKDSLVIGFKFEF